MLTHIDENGNAVMVDVSAKAPTERMARASGRSMTEFTNIVIAAYRREHPEIMAQANAFLDTINSGAFSSLLGGNADKE